MRLLTKTVWLLRVLLVLLFLGALVGQTLSWPGQFAHMAQEEPDLAHLRWPLTAAAVLALLGLQVVVVGTWKLLGMVVADRIFSTDAFVWVDTVVWGVVGAWLSFAAAAAALTVTIFLTPELRDPGLPMMLAAVTLVGAVAVLVVVVLRALLHQAADLRTDLDAVI